MLLYYNIFHVEINFELKKIQFCLYIQALEVISSLCVSSAHCNQASYHLKACSRLLSAKGW